MAPDGYRPAEAAARLGIAGNTLRVYALRFAQVLSASAARGDGEPGHRRYTDDDIAILARAKEMLAAGATYEQTLARLTRLGQTATTAITAPHARKTAETEAMAAMQDALSAWKALAEERAREVSALRERITELERLLTGAGATTTPPAPGVSLSPPVGAPGEDNTAAPTSRSDDVGTPRPTPAKRREGTQAESTQQPRWWNRLFSGDPDLPDRRDG